MYQPVDHTRKRTAITRSVPQLAHAGGQKLIFSIVGRRLSVVIGMSDDVKICSDQSGEASRDVELCSYSTNVRRLLIRRSV